MTHNVASAITLCLLGAWLTQATAGESAAGWRDAASRQAIIHDWMLQDYMNVALPAVQERRKQSWRAAHLQAPEADLEDPVLTNLACFVGQRGSLVEQRMIARVLQEVGEPGESLRLAAGSLADRGAPGVDPRWKELYVHACELRREKRLQPLLASWQRFVFDRRAHTPKSWKYTEALSDAQTDRHRYFTPGASLHILEMNGLYGKERTLAEDPHGVLRNPDISYDGRHLLFSWKKSDRDDDYHLYEMDLASEEIRQITHGLGYADYEGAYLPDGSIIFSSTRCGQTVPCNWVDVSNLYLVNRDGHFMRRVGFDQVHTIFPTVADDGRVLYTRWEYSDRGQIYPQPLFQMYADGANQRELYGANSWFPTNIIHARKIPGSIKVLAIVTGHHRPAHGKLAIIDPGVGRQEGQGVQLIAPVRPAKYVRVDRYALQGNQFQYPYPLDEEHCLVTLALPTSTGELGRFDIFFMDARGRRELLVQGESAGDVGVGCKQIVPLAPRAAPRDRPSMLDYRKETGTFYVQDVHEGPGLRGVPRGTVKRLRVVALEYRAAAIGRLHQEGPGGGSEMTTPIAIGNGSWDVKAVLGDAQVYDDGSALFQVPARTPVYFQALDEQNRAVQTMRSWTVLLPGEYLSCAGCHDKKNRSPVAERPMTMALQAGVQQLQPFYGPPRGFSFPKEIQPILDRHCIECHNGDVDKSFSLLSRTVLMSEMKRRVSESYLALTHAQGSNGDPNHPLVNWIDSMSSPAMLPPYHRGSATSTLLVMLEEGHEGVTLSREELDKIACWIDLLAPYCGDYREANAWSQEETNLYDRFAKKRQRMEAEERASIQAWIEAAGDRSSQGGE